MPGYYTRGGSAVQLNGEALFNRLDGLQSLNQDSYEILAGPFKQLSFENVFGYHFWDLSISPKTLNATSKKKTAIPNVFLRDVLLPAEARAKAGKMSATITISSDLGRPRKSEGQGYCPEDNSMYGDIQSATAANGKDWVGCFQPTADGKADTSAKRIAFGRVGKSKTAYGQLLRAEGLRMIDQILAYKTLAPNAMSNYYSEDDFLAPRKALTMFQRPDFVLEVCRKLNSKGMKLHVKSYCGKFAGNVSKYEAAGLLAPNDSELATIDNKFDLLLLKRYVTVDYTNKLNSSQIQEIANCIDSVTIYDQGHAVAVGVDDIMPWNMNIVAEMNSCVSYVRKALPNIKINIGLYSYSSDPAVNFSSKHMQSNIDLARKVAADGYEFFTAPWDRDDSFMKADFAPPAANTESLRIESDTYNYLKNQRLRNDLSPAQQQRPRFTDF